MFDLETFKFHVDDLSEHWQKIAKNLDPQVSTLWVVFFRGRVFGVYLSVKDAAKAVAAIESALAAGKTPQPQSALKAQLERRIKDFKED